MIEVSMTEIALMVWAGLATAVAFHYRAKEDMARKFVHALLRDRELRDRVVADFEEHTRSEA
jgi:hypothetical protein